MSDELTARSEPDTTAAIPSPEIVANASRYKAKIDAVSPDSRRTTFEREHGECFLGVSLENSNFVRPKLAAILEWISRRFPRCTVLIGDGIHRITLETTRQLPPAAARDEALRLGRMFVDQEQHVFAGFPATRFTFMNCSEVQTWDRYLHYLDQLHALFERDLAFRTSVEGFGRSYHSKHSHGISEEDRARRIARSSEYFLEEFAIFSCLRERGLGVMVYPGSFSTLSEIAAGHYPDAPAPLRDLVVVSLHMRGR